MSAAQMRSRANRLVTNVDDQEIHDYVRQEAERTKSPRAMIVRELILAGVAARKASSPQQASA